MVKTKKTALLLSIVAIGISCSAFLLRSTTSDKFKIYFNEKLIEGKKDYLKGKGASLAGSTRPNIIVILADDLGQTDISLYGNKLISTPNIDAIGKEGVTFTEGYISSPVCSPSRAGLITGRYQQRF